MIENIKFGKQERELEKRKKGTGIKAQLSEFGRNISIVIISNKIIICYRSCLLYTSDHLKTSAGESIAI